eukprot:4842682-Pleurochrysis_carterae.AAC.2
MSVLGLSNQRYPPKYSDAIQRGLLHVPQKSAESLNCRYSALLLAAAAAAPQRCCPADTNQVPARAAKISCTTECLGETSRVIVITNTNIVDIWPCSTRFVLRSEPALDKLGRRLPKVSTKMLSHITAGGGTRAAMQAGRSKKNGIQSPSKQEGSPAEGKGASCKGASCKRLTIINLR